MPLLSSYIEILGYIDSQRLITGNKKYDKYVCVDSGRQIIVYSTKPISCDIASYIIKLIEQFFTCYIMEKTI